jgi:hypothetical protein
VLGQGRSRVLIREQEEKQVNGHNREGRREAKQAENPRPGGQEGGGHLPEQVLGLVREAVDGALDGRVRQITAGDGQPLGEVLLTPLERIVPEGGQIGDEFEKLGNDGRGDAEQQRRHEQHKEAVQQNDGESAADPEAPFEQGDHRPQDQGNDPRDGQGPDHAGKRGNEAGDARQQHIEQPANRAEGGEAERETDKLPLEGREEGRGFRGHRATVRRQQG